MFNKELLVILVSSVDQWVKDWQKKDVIDDKHQYGKSQNIKKGRKKNL